MKRESFWLLAVVAQLILVCVPARADDGSGSSVLSRVVAVPKGAAGVVCGVMLGVPIRTGKYICSESHRMTQTLLDDFGGPGLANMTMARPVGIAYGIASGTVLGLIRGVQYGVEYGVEEPFSKKSIGIGEPCSVSTP